MLPPAYDGPRPIRILHLEDSPADHQLALAALRKTAMPCDMRRVDSLGEFAREIAEREFDVILADYRLPGFTALDAWRLLSAHPSHPPFILVSGAIGETAAVDALHHGISDYLLKEDMHRLGRVVARALEVHEARVARERAAAALTASRQQLAELTEHLQTSIEQERAAIAREIHDDIGGSLAAVQFDLAWIVRHAGDTEQRRHAQAAQDMLQHALGASQRIMMNLRPPVLDQGLVAAIQWLARNFEQRTAIAVDFHATAEHIPASQPVQLVAYRTAQEALTNVSKYAQCSRVRIDLSGSENVLTLEVSDNGQGLAMGSLDKPRAFGLKGLRERARTVDGWLDVGSQAGRGTSVTLSVPLSADAAPSGEEDAP
ncbi:histidine kinase [Ramlibacter sp. H39-3-26]|uniref:ATP-binding response regulator n=1 Tax=Curvibacter soli TaxID=3031331 RepID=UPI0023DA0991|nr:response regulator [Ramlibacter sp. H39-3-26]MDF1485759.1 histidine kinase [Ramlibacter sp. H39-3-26]